MRLMKSLDAWTTPHFNDVLKREMAELPVDALPLQQGLSHGSSVLDEARSVMVIGVSDTAERIRAKVGVFYSGILGGCACEADPTPLEPLNEYCEMMIEIDKRTADTTATLVQQKDD